VLKSVQQQVIKELEEIPPEVQETILIIIRLIKNEILITNRTKRRKKKIKALVDVDRIAIDTGISDFADQHDHYLYGVPKK
jgi:hypothetical protein